jgi:hypothetical protein
MARFACLADSIRSWHGIMVLHHNEMEAPLVSQDQSHMVWLALPALLTQSTACMESRFFAMMKWLPYGFPGSVSHGVARLACLADSIRSRHGIMILCHDEMAALWLPRICCMARFACLADSIRSAWNHDSSPQ